VCYTNQVQKSMHSTVDLHLEEQDDDEHEVTSMPKIPASSFATTNGGSDRKVPQEEPSGKSLLCHIAAKLGEEPIANQEGNSSSADADADQPRSRRSGSFTLNSVPKVLPMTRSSQCLAKPRSPFNVGENTIEYDEFPALSTEERDMRAAFKLISCVMEGTFTIKPMSSRVVLCSDVNGSGNVVEEVHTYDRHRALHNVVVGSEIHLKTAMSRYTAAPSD
jgi:hypothetical protein